MADTEDLRSSPRSGKKHTKTATEARPSRLDLEQYISGMMMGSHEMKHPLQGGANGHIIGSFCLAYARQHPHPLGGWCQWSYYW